VRGDGKDLGTGENVVTKDNLADEKTEQLFDANLQRKRSIAPPVFKK
jgi:ribosomal protein L28